MSWIALIFFCVYVNAIFIHILFCLNYAVKNINDVEELNQRWSKSINILIAFSVLLIILNYSILGVLYLYIQIFIFVLLYALTLYIDIDNKDLEKSWIYIDTMMVFFPIIIKYLIWIYLLYYLFNLLFFLLLK